MSARILFKHALFTLSLSSLLLLSGLSGCSSTLNEAKNKAENEVELDTATSISAEPVIDNTEKKAPLPEAEIEYANFSQDILNRVIIAEMAIQRGLNQPALDDYLAMAKETSDLNIIKRASRISTYNRDTSGSIEMANLWLSIEPDASEAHQTLAYQLISQRRYRQSLHHVSQLLEQGRAGIDFRIISNSVSQDSNAYLIIEPLIADFEALHLQYPKNLSLFLSLAHLYQQNNQAQAAYDALTELATQMDNPPEIVMLEVQLLEQLNKPKQARTRLEQGLKSNSQHKQLRLLYGRKLVDEERYDDAHEQFSIITQQYPEDFDLLFSLALINLEINRYEHAKISLEKLIENNQHLDDAHFYLAFINTQEKNIDQAIEHYFQVKTGNNFLPAQRNVTELMITKGRYPEANSRLQAIRFNRANYNMPLLIMEANILLDLGLQMEAQPFLNNAIGAYPNNVQLLFLRSILSQELNDLTLMEQDLRKVIQLNPTNPAAYNSLGYTLADRTERYDEAYELIKHAINLSPDDPAIMDSLGWVQYHLGMYKEAKISLERAYELFPDHEVAAHLGEVLWALGKTTAATQIWQGALEKEPNSEFILNAMKKLTAMPTS